MRAIVSIIALGAGLAACSPQIPDSAAGVGLETSPFDPALAARTTVTGDPLVPPAAVSSEPLATVASDIPSAPRSPASTSAAGTLASDDIAAETAAALAASNGNSGAAPLDASPSNPAPQIAGNPGISDENDFNAVAARESIESDAARIAQNRAQYEEVAPTAVPQRDSATGPNVVAYALSTDNPRGNRIYSRTGINLKAKSSRNCAAYASPDLAQQAFLEMGGPQRDRKALDPDGDGYACGWDPAPYRRAASS